MKLRGTTSVLAAAVAVGLVALVGASSEEQVIEAVPAPAAIIQSPPAPAPGIGHARASVQEVFGEEFTDPLGVYAVEGGYETWRVPGGEDLGFDPYSAPTPEVIQPDGVKELDPVIVPLPVAPATIPVTTVESVGTQKAGALLSPPVRGRSSSKFGMRFHPVLRVYKLHTGHDWAAPCGTPVGAAAAGTVVGTGWAGGNGVQVKIDHGRLGGYRVATTYNHLSSIGVKVGQKVSALQGVGRVGSTGYSTGCHLHFEVIVNGQFTDPIPWLNGKPGVVDLSVMMTLAPGTPSSSASPSPSPSPSPSLSPSVTGQPSVSATSEPPPAPEPGDTSAAGPKPSTPAPGTTSNPPSAPGTTPAPTPTTTSAAPKPSPSASATTKSPEPSPVTSSPAPPPPPPPPPPPSSTPPAPSPEPSPTPVPSQTVTESLSEVPSTPAAPSPTVVESVTASAEA